MIDLSQLYESCRGVKKRLELPYICQVICPQLVLTFLGFVCLERGLDVCSDSTSMGIPSCGSTSFFFFGVAVVWMAGGGDSILATIFFFFLED